MDSKDIKSEYLNGVYSEISDLLGIEAAVTLHSEFRGQQINFPVNFFFERIHIKPYCGRV